RSSAGRATAMAGSYPNWAGARCAMAGAMAGRWFMSFPLRAASPRRSSRSPRTPTGPRPEPAIARHCMNWPGGWSGRCDAPVIRSVVVDDVASLEIAKVAKQLADQRNLGHAAFGHATRQGDDAATLQPETLDIADGAIGRERDGDDLTLHLLRAGRTVMAPARADVIPARPGQQSLRRRPPDQAGQILHRGPSDLDLRQIDIGWHEAVVTIDWRTGRQPQNGHKGQD